MNLANSMDLMCWGGELELGDSVFFLSPEILLFSGGSAALTSN